MCSSFEVPWSWLNSLAFLPTVWIQRWDWHTHICIHLPSYPRTHTRTGICPPTQEENWEVAWPVCCPPITATLHDGAEEGMSCGPSGQWTRAGWGGRGMLAEKSDGGTYKCDLLQDTGAQPPSMEGSGWVGRDQEAAVRPLEWRPLYLRNGTQARVVAMVK